MMLDLLSTTSKYLTSITLAQLAAQFGNEINMCQKSCIKNQCFESWIKQNTTVQFNNCLYILLKIRYPAIRADLFYLNPRLFPIYRNLFVLATLFRKGFVLHGKQHHQSPQIRTLSE